ncbi:MAG: RDD family protein [Cyanobacteria bacterium P01_H01_bin.121]
MRGEPRSRRYPRAPFDRRAGALAIDAIVAAVPASLGDLGLQLIGFGLLWFILRVVVVVRNRGQSLGRWAFDLTIVDDRFGRTPGLLPLLQRELIVGLEILFLLEGFLNLSPQNGWVILALLPIGIDAAAAFTNLDVRQALHDRWAQTLVIQTRRGFSLDLRIKQLLAQTDPRMK